MGVALVRTCVVLALAATAGCATSVGAPRGDDPPVAGGSIPSDPVARALDDTSVVFFPRLGNPDDDRNGSHGPGLVLLGSDLAPSRAFVWMHDIVAADPVRVAGDVVVLCDGDDDEYSSPLFAMAPFNSVQTIRVPPGASIADLVLVARRLASAEIVYLADGDAAAYARWASTPLAAAVSQVVAARGVVAGAGAGARAMAPAMLVASGDADVTSTDALADPYGPPMSVVAGPFAFGVLTATIVETRIESANRFGLLAAASARALAEGVYPAQPGRVAGIGIDDGVALAFDRAGTMRMLAGGSAWMLRGGAPDRIAKGEPLAWTVDVERFDSPGESFDPSRSCGTAFGYRVAIDGSASRPFTPSDPYEAQGTSAPCPP